MNKNIVEDYKKQLEEIEKLLTDEMISKLSKEEIHDYIILVTKIKARLELLENS